MEVLFDPAPKSFLSKGRKRTLRVKPRQVSPSQNAPRAAACNRVGEARKPGPQPKPGMGGGGGGSAQKRAAKIRSVLVVPALHELGLHPGHVHIGGTLRFAGLGSSGSIAGASRISPLLNASVPFAMNSCRNTFARPRGCCLFHRALAM